MRGTFIITWRTLGCFLPPGSNTLSLLELGDPSAHLTLTRSLDTLAFEIDQRTALANVHWSGVGAASSVAAAVAAQVVTIQKQRKERWGDGPYLHLRVTLEAERHIAQEIHDFGSFRAAFFVPSGPQLWPIANTIAEHALAAFALAEDQLAGVEEVTRGMWWHSDDGRALYVFQPPEIQATGFAGWPVSDEKVRETATWYPQLVRHRWLLRVQGLLLASLSNSDDPLRAFIFAWFALELLTHKLAEVYAPPGTRNRIRDRFNAVSQALDGAGGGRDAAFARARVIRNALLHGDDVIIDTLPSRSVQALVRKYLRLHLSATSSARTAE